MTTLRILAVVVAICSLENAAEAACKTRAKFARGNGPFRSIVCQPSSGMFYLLKGGEVSTSGALCNVATQALTDANAAGVEYKIKTVVHWSECANTASHQTGSCVEVPKSAVLEAVKWCDLSTGLTVSYSE